MAITRSVWIDDDGSGTTGTPINNAELQKIYNNIDAMPLPVPVRMGTTHASETLSVGAYNNYRPPNGENCYLWIFGSAVGAPQAITGFLAESPYTQHLLVNAGGSSIEIYNQHVNSASGNRVIVPGYSTSYFLTVWHSILMTYVPVYGAWILHKAT